MRILTTLALASFAAPALAQSAEILMVGNSYTERNQLSALLEQQLAQDVPGWSAVAATDITAGGKTLTQHLADADGTNGDSPLRQALVTAPHPWALVVLQEQSQTPGFPMDDPLWTTSRDSAVALDGLIAATGADTVFYGTWGRREGDAQNPDLYPDFQTMQDRITAGYQAYAAAASTPDRAVYIAPVGEAFRVIHDGVPGDPAVAGTAFWELYAADGSHPSIAGSQLAAATLFAAWTGRRPTPNPGLIAAGLEAERQQSAIDAAVVMTLDDPLGDFAWPWVHRWADWGGAPIDGAVQRPLVWLDGSASAGELSIGDGTLLLVEGASLSADAVAIGPLGALDWRAGTLSTPTVDGDLAIPASGVLEIRDRTEVSGSVAGAGSIRWTGDLDGADERVILTAGALDLSAIDVEIERWEIRGTSLVVLGAGRAGCGCTSTGRSAPPAWLGFALVISLARRRELAFQLGSVSRIESSHSSRG